MISTRGRYAIRVLIDLAENENGSYIPLKDIAARQNISKKYLEIIVKDMVAGGLLTGVSGKGGGYKLNRKPEEYNIGEVTVPCPRAGECETLPMWAEYDKLTHDFFHSKWLSDLVRK